MSVVLISSGSLDKPEISKSISDKTFGSSRSFYRGSFMNFQETIKPHLPPEQFQLGGGYGTLIGEADYPKLLETPGFTQRFKFFGWLKESMERKEKLYKENKLSGEQKTYESSEMAKPDVKEKSNLFPNMPGVESYKMKVKIRNVKDFIPKSFD